MSLEHSPAKRGFGTLAYGASTFGTTVSGSSAGGDPVLRPPEAARYCGLSESTFNKLRMTPGAGPAFVKLTLRSVGYRISALNAWLDTRSRESTQAA